MRIFEPNIYELLYNINHKKQIYKLFKEYSKMIDEEGAHLNLRGLMQFKKTKSIPIEEVEPVESFVVDKYVFRLHIRKN